MEYAAGGELFERICNAGRFSEDEARYYFKQLISGVSYCHAMQICHRDLKLENTLLDGSSSSQLKICDFGYSKSSVLHSQPKSTVGTPAYVAPEVLSRKEYNGKIADVWSCGVTLYVMLVGAYPFEDPEDPRNIRKTIQRILSVHYTIPDYVRISSECKSLLSLIFVADPDKEDAVANVVSKTTAKEDAVANAVSKATALGVDLEGIALILAFNTLVSKLVVRFQPEEKFVAFGNALMALENKAASAIIGRSLKTEPVNHTMEVVIQWLSFRVLIVFSTFVTFGFDSTWLASHVKAIWLFCAKFVVAYLPDWSPLDLKELALDELKGLKELLKLLKD
ncbi:unnamed protein product [Arabis nemorensis]|uniref:non-specific serine/threonine protein kinase n=1 Tax=Arabis nemorensis TaxID=586526 RepID=A0A565C826_9BRAS|nr:unnamed protein product [Arabis nemorensis]